MRAPRRLLRGAACAVLPGEAVIVGCLVGGVRIPYRVLAAAEVAVIVLLLAEAGAFLWLRRRLGARAALYELVPEGVVRLVRHELRLLASLVRWVARRPHGPGPGVEAFGHARDQAALMYGFAFVCVVETVGMSYLLAEWPLVHAVVLLLDVYTVVFVLGLHAASATRPHLLGGGVLRLRHAAHVDLAVPLDRITAVRHEPLFSHTKEDGVLNLAVGAQTSVTVELAPPVEVVGLLGRRRPVHTVRFHADDARALLAALRRARTGPSPCLGTPG
ncbi:hypothetical protein [Streptomyces sp. NPDC047928]|uniref:hypothetical protein n=1 Tax=unclassified Streptomyces TaxID=2593676 RepID=UPI003720B3AF